MIPPPIPAGEIPHAGERIVLSIFAGFVDISREWETGKTTIPSGQAIHRQRRRDNEQKLVGTLPAAEENWTSHGALNYGNFGTVKNGIRSNYSAPDRHSEAGG